MQILRNPSKITIALILVFFLNAILGITLSSLIVPVLGFHFGTITIFSNIYTGGGNSSNHIHEYDPINKEVYTSETVKWSNPTAGHPYPHTVTFISNQSSALLKSKISNITKSFQSTNLQSLISNLIKINNESSIQNGTQNHTIDARSLLFPSIINSSGLDVSYLDPGGNQLYRGAVYNMTGNETFLNSGLIWAGGVVPNGFPKVNSFIITFMNPGTYHYQCLIYPEMKGTITVKPDTGLLGMHGMHMK